MLNERETTMVQEHDTIEMGGFGARFMARTEAFSLVEHPIAPRTLAAPMHAHRHEDEYTYVLEGEIGVQIGDDVRYATAGDVVFKPRGIPHAFWNRTDEPARALEIISPGGFEQYFAELAPLVTQCPPDLAGVAALAERYGLDMDPESIGTLCEREGLRPPGA
jgi:mannose-6-phosphate isomerase-like protein (cupin superfamily)